MSKPLKVGEILELSAEPGVLYAVTKREKFNWESNTTDHFTATVAAAANSGWVDLAALEPRKVPMELVQGVLCSEDRFDYYLKYPSGTNIHGVNRDKDIGFLNSERSHPLMPNDDYEFWAVYGWFPSVNAKNHTAYTDTPQVQCQGWRYTIRVATAKEVAAVASGRRVARYCQMGGVQQAEGS